MRAGLRLFFNQVEQPWLYKAKLCGNNPQFTFFDKRIVLPISVGQPYHEGDKFAALLKLIEKMQCLSCSIVLADELQRHNYQLLFATSSREAIRQTYKYGSAWLERNMIYLKMLSIPYNIVRWKECLSHKNFIPCREKLYALKETNAEYCKALEFDAQTFVLRQKRSTVPFKNIDEIKLALICQEYLIEETAVIISHFLGARYHYILYPGAAPTSAELFINPLNSPFLKYLRVYFKKRS